MKKSNKKTTEKMKLTEILEPKKYRYSLVKYEIDGQIFVSVVDNTTVKINELEVTILFESDNESELFDIIKNMDSDTNNN